MALVVLRFAVGAQQQHATISRALGELAQHRVLLLAGQQMKHVVAHHQIKPGPVQFAFEGLVQAAGQQPAAAAAGVIREGFAALLQHQLTGLEHRQRSISAGVEQLWKFIAGAGAHHQHLLRIAGCAADRGSGDLVQNVVAGDGVLNALAIAAPVVAVEIKGGHRAPPWSCLNDGRHG